MTMLLDGERVDPEAGAEGLRELVRVRRLVPLRLRVDGREVGLQGLAALAGNEGAVELQTEPLDAAAARAYAAGEAHLAALEAALDACCAHLLLGRVREGMESFSGVCLGLDSFFALMRPLDSLLGVPVPDGWEPLAARLEPLLLATREALAQEDWVLVGDQWRYEWSPWLRQCRQRLPRAGADAARTAATKAVEP